jgi:polyisoprenyl-phosphate glycosyltransferase
LRHERWEWIIVDDHSSDGTFETVRQLAWQDPRVHGFRLARNSGSHTAIACALQHAKADCAALMVADVQDPPELLTEMLERWRAGAQIVWARRRRRPGARDGAFAVLYYWILRRLAGLTAMPPGGVDFFLIDRLVIDAFRAHAGRQVSVFVLLMWLGYRQEFVEFDKQVRAHGHSGWTLSRKMRLVADSVLSISNFPIWWCVGAGSITVLAGLVPLALALKIPGGGDRAGHVFLAALVLAVTGLLIIAAGIVGQYVWRAFDKARGRISYPIEASTELVGHEEELAAQS